MAFQEITSSRGQSIYDVNSMYYGGYDSVVKFCMDNNINDLNALDVGNKTLLFDSNVNTNLASTTVIVNRGYVFTTLISQEDYRITEDSNIRVTDDGYVRIT